MALQCQTVTFTIPSSGTYNGGTQTAIFQGNSITNGIAWAAVQSIDVSYDGGDDDHDRAICQFIPSVSGVAGTSATISLQFNYSDKSSNYMSGSVQVLVIADVN